MKNMNKLKLTALLAIAVVPVLIPTLASATVIKTGNDLFTVCKNLEKVPHLPVNELDDAAECAYYVAGFRAGLSIGSIMASKDHQSSFCMDDEVSLEQVVAVIVKYLRDHPESRNQAASWLAYTALTDGFPCKATK